MIPLTRKQRLRLLSKQCEQLYNAEYYKANRDRIRARQAAYRAANRAKVREILRRYREANRAYLAAYHRTWRAQRQEHVV